MNPFGPGVFCFRSLLITDLVSLSDVGLFTLLLLVMLLLCFESCSVVLDSLRLRGLYSPWSSPGQNTGGWLPFPFSRGSSQPRD